MATPTAAQAAALATMDAEALASDDEMRAEEQQHARPTPPTNTSSSTSSSTSIEEQAKDSGSRIEVNYNPAIATTTTSPTPAVGPISPLSAAPFTRSVSAEHKGPFCKIYTYVENHHESSITPGSSSSYQDDTLSLWRELWTAAGWTPIVLSEKHASKHPLYSELKQAFDKLPFFGPASPSLSSSSDSSSSSSSSGSSSRSGRTASFLRYLAVAQVAAEAEEAAAMATTTGMALGGGGVWLSDADVFPVQMVLGSGSSCVAAPRAGALTLYQEYNPTLVSGNSTAFEGFAKYVGFDLDWEEDPTYLFHGQEVRFFGPPPKDQYLNPASATLADAKEVYPGFHITEIAVFRHLLSLTPPTTSSSSSSYFSPPPVDVAALSGTCGTVVSTQHWLFALGNGRGSSGLSNCTYGGNACRDTPTHRHKFLLEKIHAEEDEMSTEEGTATAAAGRQQQQQQQQFSPVAAFASRGPLAASFSVRGILDLRRKVSKTADPSSALFDPRVAELLQGMEQVAPSSNRTLDKWKFVRGSLARLATRAHRAGCGFSSS
jgi:hypothetical protein